MFGEDKRNLFIAIGVIFVILVGWQFLMPALFPQDERPRRVAERPVAETAIGDRAAPGAEAAAAAAERLRQAGIDSPRVEIESSRLRGSIARLGGRIDSVTLLDYHETADEESPNIVLLSPRDAVRPYFADFGWHADREGVALPAPDTLWSADRSTLSPGRPVTLQWDNGAGLSFTRKIAIDEDFVFTVTQSVRNTTTAPLALTPYSLVARFSDATESILPFKPLFIFQDGALGVFGEDYHEADYDDMRDAYDARVDNPRARGEYRYEATGGWMGLTDKYWLVALIPDQETAYRGSFEYVPVDGGEADSFQTILEAAPLTVNPGQSVSLTSRLFAGAKEISLLDGYEESLGVERLDLAVDFGPAWFLSKPMFYVIDFFNRATGNFGVAILLLTICVRILLFPLANKAYASMSRMRKLQPEMIRLRERFKDDKQRMNSELMKLYREQKANPVAGCLPLLAQIPVFFALYYMLFVTIEMRHAPFFGWINDLSAPDPLTFITAFGFLDWPAPEFLLVGIWPLIFGATMWLQMKLNPQPMEPMQQKIMMALPFIFLFLFARFPAGAGGLLDLEQRALHRPAVADHAPHGHHPPEPRPGRREDQKDQGGGGEGHVLEAEPVHPQEDRAPRPGQGVGGGPAARVRPGATARRAGMATRAATGTHGAMAKRAGMAPSPARMRPAASLPLSRHQAPAGGRTARRAPGARMRPRGSRHAARARRARRPPGRARRGARPAPAPAHRRPSTPPPPGQGWPGGRPWPASRSASPRAGASPRPPPPGLRA